MTFRGYREGSKVNWGSENEQLTLDQINSGALLRIADALEVVAQRYNSLIDDREHWKNRALGAERQLATEQRRTAALRGLLKRAKGKSDGSL